MKSIESKLKSIESKLKSIESKLKINWNKLKVNLKANWNPYVSWLTKKSLRGGKKVRVIEYL